MPDRLSKLAALLEADPADPFVLYGLAQEHAKQGTDDAHARAIEFYDRCIAADPAYHYAYYHKAMSQIALDDNAAAATTLRAGLVAARASGEQKAMSEISSLLDQIT
ncbi:MAG: hypothetical protein KF699_04195 [Phycisphaeraceae bacterium]|nr:hypothetical protein [Phycisphaeraceae bacterium]